MSKREKVVARINPYDRPKNPGLSGRIREFRQLASIVLKTLSLVFKIAPGKFIAEMITSILDALSVVGMAWVGKIIIDSVILAARTPGHPYNNVVFWVLVEFALVGSGHAIRQYYQFSGNVLRSMISLHNNVAILEKTSRVAYQQFEDPVFMNKLTQIRREATSRPFSVMIEAFTMIRQTLTLIGMLALLVSLGLWSLLALIATAVPLFLVETWFGRELFTMQNRRSQFYRESFYVENLLTSESSIKEIKLFALAQWLIQRYESLHKTHQAEDLQLQRRKIVWNMIFTIIASIALYGTYLIIAIRAAVGAITLGAMTLYFSAFRQGQSVLQSLLSSIARLYESHLYMNTFFDFLAMPEDEPLPSELVTTEAEDKAPSIRFENVSFRYPGSDRDALTNISLEIPAGHTVALVGRNGSGKTTMIKLLTGLYQPTQGKIFIDDIDIQTLTPEQVRRRAGVILQDFVRYHFSAKDNIGIGWLPDRENTAAIEHAVDNAGAVSVIERLEQGLDTSLGKALGGDDLSGGQWQRIALARAFMRRSRILVLDEPTAAMDAEAENEIFERFKTLRHGRTVVLITHRFSTVRTADRIVVIENGQIAESGTHAELLRLESRYATMFKLQAQGYLAE